METDRHTDKKDKQIIEEPPLVTPLIKSINLEKDVFKLPMRGLDPKTVETIQKQFSSLDITKINTIKENEHPYNEFIEILRHVQQKLAIIEPKKINVINKNEEIDESNFIEKIRTNNTYKRYGNPKNYYPRPSFPDTQYEKDHIRSVMQYYGDSVIIWNIDGMIDHQILGVLSEMMTYATRKKTRLLVVFHIY